MMLCKLIDKSILLLLFAILFVHYSPSLAFADDENRIASTGDESVGSESLISEPSFSPDDTITGFRFDGLRRTKEHYLKS